MSRSEVLDRGAAMLTRGTMRFVKAGWLFSPKSAALVLALTSALAGCAKPPPASDAEGLADFNETNDPLEPTNRVFYAINNGVDTVLLRPAAVAYRYVVPGAARRGIHNALANFSSPVQLTNDILEARPRRAGDTLMRYVINTTAGVGGLFDVAKDLGYPPHDSGFGITLALWGLPSGPFLFLPVLGPSSPRDATGFGADILLDPFTWVGQGAVVKALNYGHVAIGAIDARERVLDPLDEIKKSALDPYATFRSLYRQHQDAVIEQARNDNRRTVPVWFPSQAGPAQTPSSSSGSVPVSPASLSPRP